MSADLVLTVRRIAGARRMRLAIDPRDGSVRLTLPRRASEKAARAWAEEQRGWIEAQRGKLAPALPIAPGAEIPFRGDTVTIDWAPEHSRIVRRLEGRLIVGGPLESLSRRVFAWLKRQAAAQFDMETRALAERAGVTVGKIGIGDPRSRWGSCSSRGDIRYNWRLILAPPEILSATVAHEVAHRLHMDHGPAFRAAERALSGVDAAVSHNWLKRHGAALHRVGR